MFFILSNLISNGLREYKIVRNNFSFYIRIWRKLVAYDNTLIALLSMLDPFNWRTMQQVNVLPYKCSCARAIESLKSAKVQLLKRRQLSPYPATPFWLQLWSIDSFGSPILFTSVNMYGAKEDALENSSAFAALSAGTEGLYSRLDFFSSGKIRTPSPNGC